MEKPKFWGNTYTYDAWGNLLVKHPTKCTAENLSVTVGANNQLQAPYIHDAAGNMTMMPRPISTTSMTLKTASWRRRIQLSL